MANINIPIYDVVIDDEHIGLTAVSFVDEPAIMENFVAFSAEEKMIWMSSHEKREIVSPILIPNQLILRKHEDGTPYYMRWSEKTIENAAKKFITNRFWNNVTIMHPTFYDKDMEYSDSLEKDVYLLRMWIVDDPKKDDINTKYGFKGLPKGTLCVHYKVHNRSLWNRIRSGELRGLSIEAFTNIVKSDDNNVNLNINMSKLDISRKEFGLFEKFIAFMNSVSEDADTIAKLAKKDVTDSADIKMKYYIDNEHFIEVDGEGFCRDEEYNIMKEGKYEVEDGNFVLIDGDGKFVGTEKNEHLAKIDDEEAPIEAVIAETKAKEEEDDEEKTDDVEGEDGGEGCDAPLEDDTEDGGETKEVGEETPTEDATEPIEEPTEEIPSEEPVEEVPTEEPTEEPTIDELPSTLVPFEIDGMEYLLPQEVVDYIMGLMGKNDKMVTEIAMMKDNIPSTSPIPSVIMQSDGEVSGLSDAIRKLNYRR